MELTIEHLVPYLPYELKMYDSYNDRIETLSSLHTKADECITLFYKNVGHSRRINEVKPILRPLSDLTKEIEFNGEKFVPLEILSQKDNIYYHDKYMREIISNQQHLKNQLYYYSKLFDWHFDVFNLIKNNLAIDINTL